MLGTIATFFKLKNKNSHSEVCTMSLQKDKSPEQRNIEIQEIENQIQKLKDKLIHLKRQETPVEARDYLLKGRASQDTRLSKLFGEREELLVAHFMG